MIYHGEHDGTRRKTWCGSFLRMPLRFILFFIFSGIIIPVTGFLAPDDVTLEKASEAQSAQNELFVKYQNHQGDYLVFYDREGSTLLIRYRIDRWDYTNDDLRDALRQGITYRVQIAALKKLPEGEVPKGVMGSGLPPVAVKRKIRRIRDLYSADMVSVNESALRDLRY